jgi:hypothetical protein
MSGFRREVAENCALVGYYAASSAVLKRNYICDIKIRDDFLTSNEEDMKNSTYLSLGSY